MWILAYGVRYLKGKFMGKCYNCGKQVHKAAECWSVLQEGFGLSSSPVLHGRGAGRNVIPFEAGLRMRFVPKQVVQCRPSMWQPRPQGRSVLIAMQPSYNELHHAMVHALHSQFPPPHFERALHSVNQVFHRSGAKTDVLSFTNWLSCQSRNSTAKRSGQLNKIAL